MSLKIQNPFFHNHLIFKMRHNALLQVVISFIRLLKELFLDVSNLHHGVFLL